MTTIYIPTFRRGTPEEGRAVWADLRVCLMSVEAYALDFVDEVIVAWDGPWAPDGCPEHPKFRYLERPPGMNMAQAANFAIENSTTDDLIQMGDDVVLHPDTLRFLLQDISTIRQVAPQAQIGMIAARSNFVCGQQNIRAANNSEMDPWGVYYQSEGQILQTDRIFTVLVWFPKAVWQATGRFPEDMIGMGDMLYSYDVERLGYSMFISRAYVHHIGMVGTKAAGDEPQDLFDHAIAWLHQNRPDFIRTWVARGYLDAKYLQPAGAQ